MVGVRYFSRLLQHHLNKKFPELKASFYVSKRNHKIHMVIDIALFFLTRHDQIIEEIENLRINGFDIEKNFKFLFPLHIGATRWKFAYTVMKRR